MILPDANAAYVPREKLTGYLLSMTHPVGRAKAVVMHSYGFHLDNIDILETGLLSIARSQEVVSTLPTSFGVKYVVDGTITTPDGRRLRVRTIWIVEQERRAPRFVTAYPQ